MRYLIVYKSGFVGATDDWQAFDDEFSKRNGEVTAIVDMEHRIEYDGGGNWRDVDPAPPIR